MTVYLPFNLPWAAAMAVYPFVLISARARGRHWTPAIIAHEMIHYHQQRRWFVYGLGVGLLVWWLLYLLALPIGYNPWRWRWETEAYSAECSADVIDWLLRQKPYYLWWHGK